MDIYSDGGLSHLPVGVLVIVFGCVDVMWCPGVWKEGDQLFERVTQSTIGCVWVENFRANPRFHPTSVG